MRAVKEVERRILDLIDPEAEALGYEIVRLRMSGGNRPVLQIMIDKLGGLPTDVEDCAKLSRALSPLFDVEDPISGAYTLEVSTPGIDRPLTREGDFAKWVGHAAKVELRLPIDGRRRFTGIITGEEDGVVKLTLDDERELEASISEMSKASLVLTDELIEAAQAAGSLPVQPDEITPEQGLEVEESEDDESEDETETEDR